MNDTPKQLSLFDQTETPIPLRVANEYDFTLTYIEQGSDPGKHLYLARDWYIGMGGTKTGWTHLDNDWVSSIHPVMMEVKRPHRKPEMVAFVGEEGLYYIAAKMRTLKDRPQLDVLKRYLAKAGKRLADYLRDPKKGIAELTAYDQTREYRKLIKEGFTPSEATQWLSVRSLQREQRQHITDTWATHGATGRDFAVLSNTVSYVATGKTATQHKSELTIRSPRDVLSAAENAAIAAIELLANGLHIRRESQGQSELKSDIEDTEPMINQDAIQQAYSQKRRLGDG